MISEQKIDRYLTKQMSSDESIAFEQAMELDAALRKDVALQRLAMDSVMEEGEMGLKHILQKHEIETYSKNPYYRILIVLAVMLLGFAAYYFYQRSTTPPIEIQVADYFVPYKSPVVLRSNTASTTAWSRGAEAYANGEYEVASQEFEAAETEQSAPLYLIKYYRALSLLASKSGSADLSVVLLSEVAQGSHDYVQQANWYLALAYVKADRQKEAKLLLSEIVKRRNYMHKEAGEILKKLK